MLRNLEKMAALRNISEASKKLFTVDEVAAFFQGQTSATYKETSDSDSDDDILPNNRETNTITASVAEGTRVRRNL